MITNRKFQAEKKEQVGSWEFEAGLGPAMRQRGEHHCPLPKGAAGSSRSRVCSPAPKMGGRRGLQGWHGQGAGMAGGTVRPRGWQLTEPSLAEPGYTTAVQAR